MLEKSLTGGGAHLVTQVVDGQNAARVGVDTVRAVLGRQVHRHEGRMPIICDEDDLLPVQATINR